MDYPLYIVITKMHSTACFLTVYYVCVCQERKSLLEQGFLKRADRMQAEIDSLKGEMETDDESKRSTRSTVVDTAGTAATLFLPGIASTGLGIGTSVLLRWL